MGDGGTARRGGGGGLRAWLRRVAMAGEVAAAERRRWVGGDAGARLLFLLFFDAKGFTKLFPQDFLFLMEKFLQNFFT